MKKIIWICILLFSSLLSRATHQVGGYFRVQWVTGTTYEVTFYDFTNTCNTDADRDTVRFNWGDGSSTVVSRNNGTVIDGFPNGVPICDCRKLSTYDAQHTFPGPDNTAYGCMTRTAWHLYLTCSIQ